MATPLPPPDAQSSYVPNVQKNAQSLYYVKSTLASLSGALTGLLGLTSLPGFLFYLSTYLLIGLAFSTTKAGSKPREYFVGGWWETLMGDCVGCAAPFVLFWTLFYALVHIYD
ncbi:Rab5-interacting protein-domain-containing protein [Leucosporidium creatinivorum]|uniref:ER membrane protein complex subunit 6 n=1 Tax=Leucosporidium creatinivorum TaxID=106004 RepID=A0A1Y2ESK8_9BASI|nr:Rab5-interacting protein-domain-containing protein [Leucosporidium creatinivorum]